MKETETHPGDTDADQVLDTLTARLGAMKGTHQITQLATQARVSPQTVYNVRAKKVAPGLHVTLRLLHALGYRISLKD